MGHVRTSCGKLEEEAVGYCPVAWPEQIHQLVPGPHLVGLEPCADAVVLEAKLPPLSYANDMWTGYGLDMIYERKATAIELLCASPCLTSVVLLSMESKHRQEPRTAVFDEQAHMARHRFGARGNATTFPLPVEALLQKLTAHIERTDADDAVPRRGKKLCEIFRVLLKTNKTGKTTEEQVKTLIHQARVQRQARERVKHVCRPFLGKEL